MAGYGYGSIPDRGFIAFEQELDTGAWKQISTKKHEGDAGDVTALLQAPPPVVWKVRLRRGISSVVAALGAPSLAALDQAWDAAQRRLFHRIAVGIDDDDREVRDAADRLRAQLLLGSGTAQTQLDADAQVDFGRQQMALAGDNGPLAADAKKLKLGDALADVAKTTEALAKALGRAAGTKRRPPSRKLRDALAECAAAFNAVHDELAWFVERVPAGADRDHLAALLKPLDALLARHQPAAAAVDATDAGEPAAPAPPVEKPA